MWGFLTNSAMKTGPVGNASPAGVRYNQNLTQISFLPVRHVADAPIPRGHQPPLG